MPIFAKKRQLYVRPACEIVSSRGDYCCCVRAAAVILMTYSELLSGTIDSFAFVPFVRACTPVRCYTPFDAVYDACYIFYECCRYDQTCPPLGAVFFFLLRLLYLTSPYGACFNFIAGRVQPPPFRHQRDANVEAMVLKKLLIFFSRSSSFSPAFLQIIHPIILWGFEHEIDAAG